MYKLSFLVLFISFTIRGQNPQVENLSLRDSFPKMELKVTLRNPQQQPASFFKIKEGDTVLPVIIKKVEKEHLEKESLLILMENLNRKDRLDFYKAVLEITLQEVDLKNTKVNIAVFDRVRNDGTQAIFPLLPEYTSDKTELLNAMQAIQPKNDIFGNNQSADLYHAIYEGLENLNAREGANNLLVLSSAFNNKWSSHTSSESAKAFAQKNDIAVYSLQYRIQGYEHHKLTDLAHAHYGAEIVTNKEQEASQFLRQTLVALEENQGNKYYLEYTSLQPPTGETFVATLIMGDHPIEFLAQTPDRQSWVWYTALGIFFILALLLLIFYLRKKNKKSEAEKKELEEKIAAEKRSAETIRQDLGHQASELETLKRQEAERASKAAKEAFEKEQMAKMKAYGQLPYLQYVANNGNGLKTLNYTIDKPVYSIGRAPNNDLVLNDKSVSRHHAIIDFKEDGYYLKDQNSTAGTKVNGERLVGAKKMQPNAVVSLGNVNVSFIQ